MYLVLQEAMNGQDLDREESIDLSAIEVRVIHGVIAKELNGRTRCPRSPNFSLNWSRREVGVSLKKGSKNTLTKYSISML